MLRLSRTVVLLTLVSAVFAHAKPVVTLVTVGPGDEVWERFGHNMLRLQDDDTGLDVCVNWGVFDFNQPHFISNFVRGRMLYSMAIEDTQLELDEYRQQNRHVTFQTLNLSDRQLHDLYLRCEANRKNPQYRYDYFKDNCSTRVRDMIDAVYGGRLAAMADRGRPLSPTLTYRSAFMRLMQHEFWLSLACDFSLGPAIDRPLDGWDACFLPERVSALVTPLAGPATQPWVSTRSPGPASPPRRWPWLLLTGLAGAAVIIALTAWRTWAGRLAAAFWWVISGFGGLFMLYAWLLTDHTAAYANQNLLHFSPLAWPVLALLMVRRRPAAAAVAAVIVGLSVLGTAGHGFGWLAQKDLGFILLALPLNLAAARSLTTPAGSGEVAGHAQGSPDGGDGDDPGRLREPA